MAGSDITNDRDWTDKRMETFIGNLLRAGVLSSALIVAIGAAVYLVRHGHSPTSYRTFQSEPPNLRTVSGIFREALALRGRGIIQLGLLLLIATRSRGSHFLSLDLQRSTIASMSSWRRSCS